MAAGVTRLLTDANERERCRAAAGARRNADAAARIAQWIETHAVAPERDVRIGEERSA
jgi:UDP:flavonoid glycosyltransferase YjiC (YdhE family)